MIKSFSHKGLEAFFASGSLKGIIPTHAKRLRVILATLDAAASAEEMALPAFQLHSLKGELAGMYSVSVNGNWRVIFTFQGEDAILVNYLDYH